METTDLPLPKELVLQSCEIAEDIIELLDINKSPESAASLVC